MPKNIVICGDGTGNKFEPNPTNVVRLFSILRRDDPAAQICSYYPGVGTMPAPGALATLTNSVARFAGLAVGYGLLENVSKMYEYLMDNYEEGDRIYLFGFSRGAFTVRVLAGVLHRCGLLLPGNSQLIPYALELCRHHAEGLEPDERERLEQNALDFRRNFSRPDVPVEFLGIWDTVKAYGYFWPRSLPHTRHNPAVKKVRHAIAMDERRSFYAPSTWGGLDSDFSKRPDPTQDIEEVLFAGSHSDVGGGYAAAERGLADIALRWMIEEARRSGLLVDETSLARELPRTSAEKPQDVSAAAPPALVLHPSLTFWWRWTEWFPRWELLNEPPPPRRRPRLWPAGQRPIGKYKRDRRVLVHSSARSVERPDAIPESDAGFEVVYIDTASVQNSTAPRAYPRAAIG